MALTTIISNAKLDTMLELEERTGKNFMEYIKQVELDADGYLYSVWQDRRNGKLYAVREIRSVSMGFNSNDPGKEDEFEAIMEREGVCKASWGCTGRTLHQMLAMQLADKFPQYRFDIGYNYKCEAHDDHNLHLTWMPGYEPVFDM